MVKLESLRTRNQKVTLNGKGTNNKTFTYTWQWSGGRSNPLDLSRVWNLHHLSTPQGKKWLREIFDKKFTQISAWHLLEEYKHTPNKTDKDYLTKLQDYIMDRLKIQFHEWDVILEARVSLFWCCHHIYYNGIPENCSFLIDYPLLLWLQHDYPRSHPPSANDEMMNKLLREDVVLNKKRANVYFAHMMGNFAADCYPSRTYYRDRCVLVGKYLQSVISHPAAQCPLFVKNSTKQNQKPKLLKKGRWSMSKATDNHFLKMCKMMFDSQGFTRGTDLSNLGVYHVFGETAQEFAVRTNAYVPVNQDDGGLKITGDIAMSSGLKISDELAQDFRGVCGLVSGSLRLNQLLPQPNFVLGLSDAHYFDKIETKTVEYFLFQLITNDALKLIVLLMMEIVGCYLSKVDYLLIHVFRHFEVTQAQSLHQQLRVLDVQMALLQTKIPWHQYWSLMTYIRMVTNKSDTNSYASFKFLTNTVRPHKRFDDDLGDNWYGFFNGMYCLPGVANDDISLQFGHLVGDQTLEQSLNKAMKEKNEIGEIKKRLKRKRQKKTKENDDGTSDEALTTETKENEDPTRKTSATKPRIVENDNWDTMSVMSGLSLSYGSSVAFDIAPSVVSSVAFDIAKVDAIGPAYHDIVLDDIKHGIVFTEPQKGISAFKERDTPYFALQLNGIHSYMIKESIDDEKNIDDGQLIQSNVETFKDAYMECEKIYWWQDQYSKNYKNSFEPFNGVLGFEWQKKSRINPLTNTFEGDCGDFSTWDECVEFWANREKQSKLAFGSVSRFGKWNYCKLLNYCYKNVHDHVVGIFPYLIDLSNDESRKLCLEIMMLSSFVQDDVFKQVGGGILADNRVVMSPHEAPVLRALTSQVVLLQTLNVCFVFVVVLFGIIFFVVVLFGIIFFVVVLIGIIFFVVVLIGVIFFVVVLIGIVFFVVVLIVIIFVGVVLIGIIFFAVVLFGIPFDRHNWETKLM